jgi:hypothetical protein
MALQVIDRFHAQWRRAQQQALDEGRIQQECELELLTPERMNRLAVWGLFLFVIGAVFFIGLNIAMYLLHTHHTSGTISGWPLIFWLVINILGSMLILGIHEFVHGLAFMLWGGKPYYGARLPFALYCSAHGQLFPRNYYIVVGLAPFVIITLLAILFTIIAPILASYGLLAWISNFSGAVGDLMAVRWLLHQPRDVLVEDTETGCRVWAMKR